MTLEEIHTSWAQDANIDQTELSQESQKIPILHAKYFKLYSAERLKLRKLEFDLKQLKRDKYEFYTEGPSSVEEHERYKQLGWELPARGKILRADAKDYVDSDRDVIHLQMKIAAQGEKVDVLEQIVKMITNRGYLIKNMIDWQRFMAGA